VFLDMVRAELNGDDMPTVDDLLNAKVKVGAEDWALGDAIGYSARKGFEVRRDLAAFVTGEAARDAQTAATLAAMQTALSAIASAKGALTPEQVTALAGQVRAAAEQAGAEATAEIGRKVDALRQHLGDAPIGG
jgi:hypothetical protein